MREAKKIYVCDEYHFRFGVWLTNYRFVQSKNAISKHFRCRMNSLSALTPSEYRSFMGSSEETSLSTSKSKSTRKQKRSRTSSNGLLPPTCDLRTKIPCILSPIHDVGSCRGEDWAFSVVTSIEANHCIKRGNLYKCVDVCNGCTDGSSFKALDFLAHSKLFQLRINKESD